MHQLDPSTITITDPFWRPRLDTNAGPAIDHQWVQLESSGCIDNFRLVAGDLETFREGWFFADSDAYKWLDAAARIAASQPRPSLIERIDAFVDLLGRAQAPDGYLYTYNQVHYPGQRWTNLQIEHELYCHGHLIEAGVAHHRATGRRTLLDIAQKAADRLVADFAGDGPAQTPGHQEIEIALIRLYRATGRQPYLDLAAQFLEQRGRLRPFAPHILGQNRRVERRKQDVERRRQAYLSAHPGHAAVQLPPGNPSRKPPAVHLRFMLNTLSGRYFQQHRPIRQQRVPVGHAVRFAYLQTAVAMLYRETGDESLLPALEAAWEHMVGRRIYVTGGIGALPEIEGFGRDYELDPAHAYAETCAALGSMFWNWEMSLATGRARYADLFEWQLYNAAAVGMGRDGCTYLYNNPLAARGEITRRPWYAVPCCPSNLSRTWASLGRYLYGRDDGALWVHQYVGNRAEVDVGQPLHLEVESELPWGGRVRLELSPPSPAELTLYLRLPGWAGDCRLAVNGRPVETPPRRPDPQNLAASASGCTPHWAAYLPLRRTWSPGDVVELQFPLPVTARRADARLRSARGRVALTRGPLVYCLESVDNPGLDLFEEQIDLDSLAVRPGAEPWPDAQFVAGQTVSGRPFTAIPYAFWANRGPSQMNVWLRA
jgi:hypothetical protein